MKWNLNKKKLKEIGGLIGFDVPVYLEKNNSFQNFQDIESIDLIGVISAAVPVKKASS